MTARERLHECFLVLGSVSNESGYTQSGEPAGVRHDGASGVELAGSERVARWLLPRVELVLGLDLGCQRMGQAWVLYEP